jgi:steroid delta-isomerase-like uncharacterized protein
MADAMTVLRAALDEANRRDVPAMLEHVAADVAYINPATGPTDRNGMAAFHGGLFKAFPDVHYTIERGLADEQLAVAECTVTGTHRDTFAGIPATGHTIRTSVAFSVDVAGGKITTWRSYFDPGAMARQLTG